MFAPPNGSPILGPDGRPFVSAESVIESIGSGEWKQRNSGPYDAFALPQILTFQQLWQTGWRAYWHGQSDEAIRHDRESALAMRRDSFLMGILNERRYATASLPWHLEVPDEKDPFQAMVRDALTMALRSTRNFRRMMWSLLDAIWYGRYGIQLLWRWREFNGQRILCPRAFRPVNGDKIGYMYDSTPFIEVFAGVQAKEEKPRSPATLSQEEMGEWELPNSEFVWTQQGKALVLRGSWRERFVIHQHEMEDRDFQSGDEAEAVFGKGVRDVLFALDWMKREWLANISDYFERVGQGLTLWYWDASNPASKNEVALAAKDQSNRVNIMVPRWPNAKGNNNTGVERLEVPVQGSKFLLELITYVDNYQRLYVTGQSMSIGADNEGGLGGTGRAEFAQNTKSKITAWDAHNLGETITGDEDEPGLLSIMKRWSFPDADFPVWFRIETKDPQSKDNLDAIKAVVEMRVPVKASDVRAAAGLSKPSADDELVPGEAQPAAPGMPPAPPQEPQALPVEQPGTNGATGQIPVPPQAPAEPVKFQREEPVTETAKLPPEEPERRSRSDNAYVVTDLDELSQHAGTDQARDEHGRFASEVGGIASSLPFKPTSPTQRGSHFGEDKAFIHSVYEKYKNAHPEVTRDAFNHQLLEANRQRQLELSRADMVGVMHPEDVRDSGIILEGGSLQPLPHGSQRPLNTGGEFNFVRTKDAYGKPLPKSAGSSEEKESIPDDTRKLLDAATNGKNVGWMRGIIRSMKEQKSPPEYIAYVEKKIAERKKPKSPEEPERHAQGEPCQKGERADLTQCIPAGQITGYGEPPTGAHAAAPPQGPTKAAIVPPLQAGTNPQLVPPLPPSQEIPAPEFPTHPPLAQGTPNPNLATTLFVDAVASPYFAQMKSWTPEQLSEELVLSLGTATILYQLLAKTPLPEKPNA